MFRVTASDELMINEMNDSLMSPTLKLDILGFANHVFVFLYVLLLMIALALLNLGFDLSLFFLLELACVHRRNQKTFRPKKNAPSGSKVSGPSHPLFLLV